jgi:hypothetical protein
MPQIWDATGKFPANFVSYASRYFLSARMKTILAIYSIYLKTLRNENKSNLLQEYGSTQKIALMSVKVEHASL